MYAPNGNMLSYLRADSGQPRLEPFQMIDIISGIGKGLQYLHAKYVQISVLSQKKKNEIKILSAELKAAILYFFSFHRKIADNFCNLVTLISVPAKCG